MLLFLSGCGGSSSVPAKFYVLSPLEIGSNADALTAIPQSDLALGIGPVELPEHLNRPQIVTRNNQNNVDLSEFHQWAEPLEANFSRVLAENLSELMKTDRISIFPWRGSTPIDYQVIVEVTEFVGKIGKGSVLKARWTVLTNNGKDTLVMKKSNFRQPVPSADFEGLVAAMNQTLTDLSLEIATFLQTLNQS